MNTDLGDDQEQDIVNINEINLDTDSNDSESDSGPEFAVFRMRRKAPAVENVCNQIQTIHDSNSENGLPEKF